MTKTKRRPTPKKADLAQRANESIQAERLMTEQELVQLTGFSLVWAQKGRCYGYGPPFIKIGRNIRYRRSDVEQWLEQRRVDPSASSSPCTTQA